VSIIYVLIGPKGSGKSYIGRLLQREFGIKFLSIEELFIKLQGQGVSTPEVQEKGYKAVEEKVSATLARGTAASFEITVLTPSSRDLLNRLEQQARVEIIRVYAPLELCLERIKTRDTASHIEISQEKIREINQLSAKQQINAKFRIDTSEMTDEQILEKFRSIWNKGFKDSRG
jgi:predicted kinase